MNWTDAQIDAIKSRGSTLLVSAGAGSGKTAVLTARILSLLKEGVSLDELLIVTFTRAAAAEMRQRIVKALHEAAGSDKSLAAQALRVERADITTLHGFCAKVCREYFHAVRADPMFRVMDDMERNVLAERALNEALLSCFEAPSECFSYAAECLTQEQLQEATLSLHQFIMTRPNPFLWLDAKIEAAEMSGERLESSDWATELLESVGWGLQSANHLYRTLLDALDGAPKYKAFIQQEMAACDALLREIPNGVAACARVPKRESIRKPAKAKDADEAFEKWFAKTNEKAREAVKEAYETIEWIADVDARSDENKTGCLILRGLAEAVKRFDSVFSRMKSERNRLDYNDLEHYAYEALASETVASAYQKKYAHVFVDEYQDSSLLQEAILQCVCRAGGLFMVGDVKQSIYRFRQAEPSLFLQKLQDFSTEKGAPNRSVFLNQNFRSHPDILRCINDLFTQVFWGERMEIVYDQNARLVEGGKWKSIQDAVELHLIVRDDEAPTEEEQAETESIRHEANVIANRIKALQNADQGYKLRDMAILLRVMKGKASHVADVLRQSGIASKADIGEDTLSQVEIQDALSLLKTIDNFHQDVPLIASLKGPAMNLTSEQIATIRVHHPQGSFSDAVLAYAEKDDPLAGALRAFRSQIEAWAMEALVCPLDSMIRKICDQKHLFQIAGAMPDGKTRQEHLYLLAEAAAIFQQQEEGGLSGFLRYIDRVQKKEGLAAQNLGEQENVVRILSIHKSKGLEFPIVFVAGLGSNFSYKDTTEMLQAHPELGVGIHAIDPMLRLKQDTMIRKAIVQRKKTEALAEQARILYVALTRAERRLVMVGSSSQSMEALKKGDVRFARSFLQWIAPVADESAGWKVEEHQVAPGRREERQQLIQEIVQSIMAAEKPFAGGTVSMALSWRRPEIPRKPLKQSVTQRVRAMEEDYVQKLEDLPTRPLFLEEKGLTASEKGESAHAFLRSIPLGEKDFEAACRSFVEKGILSEEQAAALPMRELKLFLNHPLWQRISDAPRTHREWPFNLRQDAGEGVTLLQGIIDCCFIEDGQWVLVDYKTDHADEATIVERHRQQVLLYADALERLTGIGVKERIVFAIALGKALKV